MQFVGGEGYKNLDDYEYAPMDKLVLVYAKEEEPEKVWKVSHKDLKALDEDSAKAIFG